mmetsp:Transcript_24142/g.4036  ORF Transcript_24142/g.4036 Transcript_24142/m.4036 type:complete len:80 (+) Transcript_24142:1680-1919(+)
MLFMALLPFLIVLICTVLWGAVTVITRDTYYMKNQYVTTLVVLMFLAHPDIVERIFAVFSCTEIDNGEFYLNDDLDLEC